MIPRRLALTLLIFLLSVVTLLLLSSVMIGVLPFLRIEGVIAIMGILAAILFKIPDLIDWLNTRPALPEWSQAMRTPASVTQAETTPAHPDALAVSHQSLPAIPPMLQEWDRMAKTDHATLILAYKNRLVDIEFNPPLLRVTDTLVANLILGIRSITTGSFDPIAAAGIGYRLFGQIFPAHHNVQIDTKKRDLFVYYPDSPEDLGTIPYELIRKWGSEWGVLRLPDGKPGDAQAATLRRVLAAFHAPPKFRLLIVVYIDKKWQDVDRVLNEWLSCLPSSVEPEVYLNERATPGRVRNLIAGGYDAIYFIAHHHGGRLDLHEGELDLKDLTVKDNPLIFLNACEAAQIDSRAVREFLESGAGFVIGTLNKVEAVEAIRFGGLFFDALFGCSTYHDYLNRTEHYGLKLPDRRLPVARALSWARRCFESRSDIVWSYVLFGQPDPHKLEKLIPDMAEELRRHGRWKEYVEVQRSIRSEEDIRDVVRTEIDACLTAGNWRAIEAMLQLPTPYYEDLCEEVQSWAEEKFSKHEWQEVLEHKEVLEPFGSNPITRAEKAALADQLVTEVKQSLKI